MRCNQCLEEWNEEQSSPRIICGDCEETLRKQLRLLVYAIGDTGLTYIVNKPATREMSDEERVTLSVPLLLLREIDGLLREYWQQHTKAGE